MPTTPTYPEKHRVEITHMQNDELLRIQDISNTEKPVIVTRGSALNPKHDGSLFIVRVPKPAYFQCQTQYPAESIVLMKCYQKHDILTPQERVEVVDYLRRMAQ